MLQALEKHTRAYSELSRRLYKQADRYISEYRYYNATEFIGHPIYVHDFVLPTDKMVMHNDFHVTPIDK